MPSADYYAGIGTVMNDDNENGDTNSPLCTKPVQRYVELEQQRILQSPRSSRQFLVEWGERRTVARKVRHTPFVSAHGNRTAEIVQNSSSSLYKSNHSSTATACARSHAADRVGADGVLYRIHTFESTLKNQKTPSPLLTQSSSTH